MSSPTSNFGWLKPTIGGDNDIWGDELNANLNNQDALIRNMINNFIASSAPTEAQAGTIWLDNTSNPYVLKIYDGADWIIMGYMNISTNTFDAPSTTNYIGDIKISAQTTNHGSWLLCNGASLSTTTYSGLFALIGYSFGGSGANFTLPDMRGAVQGTIGTGTYSGASTRTIGQFVGAETHTLTIPQMPSHSHHVNASDAGGASAFGASAGGGNLTTDSTGGGLAHNNMQPTLFIGNTFIFSGV